MRLWHHQWGEDDKLDFVIEAGIREDYFQGLERWAESGLLDDAQMAQYREIKCLVETGRRLLAPLLAED